ncbi:lipolytic enzyme [Blastopirellula marina]|uniref:Lipolytic enzyme n=2 Tax=Pirellulales TaxID=2691354 RepID=A0A2S8G536_9BACT|nr:lipolytic enzyme [Blastopirellula marina]RCS55718.1 lipolytic enzyme [Bremerella cremea]
MLLFVPSSLLAEETNPTPSGAHSLGSFTAQDLAGKRVVFLGDSITQAGGYVSFVDYYLEKLYPQQDFDIYGLGLASETLSGLSEDGHAGGAFPRPCLFERLGRLLERVKPEVVFACYGINDGIYKPLDAERFSAFQQGVNKLIEQCQAAGVEQIVLVTPPIYDETTKPGEFNYDSVMTKYAAWQMALEKPAVHVIDLHSAMRKARDARTEVFSKDRVHPGAEGHLFMAQSILAALDVPVPQQTPEAIQADPLYKQVDKLRKHRSANWMKHVGYTREKTVSPQPLGDTEDVAAQLKEKINQLRRK